MVEVTPQAQLIIGIITFVVFSVLIIKTIKNIAPSLFSVPSFFLSHLRITVIYKSTNNYTTKNDQCITSAFSAF